MAAVMNVAWPISTEYGEESRYNTLLQISIGQEEVDEVITRDIHRTFPEHPQFGFAQGQQALFRILKAYSLHDLEVCPCLWLMHTAPLAQLIPCPCSPHQTRFIFPHATWLAPSCHTGRVLCTQTRDLGGDKLSLLCT